MSSAVLYFNRGARCYIRLAVSVYSLRRFYGGTIRLVQEGDLEPSMRTFLEELDVEIDEIPLADEPVLVAKSSLWRRMKYDRVLFIDSDTLIQGPVDEFFDWIREKQTVLTWFADWKTDGPKIRRRIEEWRKVSPELIEPAISYGAAINTGVQGWTKGTPILPAYEELTRLGYDAGCRKLILDEIAMQLLAPNYPHYLAGPEWNASGKYGDLENARIVHFHGRKHCRDDNPRADLWKELYFEVLNRFPQHHELLSEAWGDRRLSRFRKRIFKRRRNMTVVSAVNPKYAERMQKTFKNG